MAIVHGTPKRESWWLRLATTDFCPWANRFVYWLKEPVGWFALATAVCVMIGLYFSPIGWTLAGSLTAIMVTGMVWPWFAVRVTQCGLHPEVDAIHEGTLCRMVFSVRNRVPLPVWGLAVEGYLDCDAGDGGEDTVQPTVGLACVPPLCTADYSVGVIPEHRGRYPAVQPQVTCSFPFGIWTARRPLKELKPVTVWPKVYAMAGVLPIVGHANADQGEGSRGGRSGDYVGVRSFRRGDSAKHVNWIASARSDSLIVTERGGPQSVQLDVFVDTRNLNTRSHFGRESLARRIRVAASVLASLHQSRIDTRVRLGDRSLRYQLNALGRRQMLDALADVPAGGCDCVLPESTRNHASVVISGESSGDVVVHFNNPSGGRRAGGSVREIKIGVQQDLDAAMEGLWTEVRDADVAA